MHYYHTVWIFAPPSSYKYNSQVLVTLGQLLFFILLKYQPSTHEVLATIPYKKHFLIFCQLFVTSYMSPKKWTCLFIYMYCALLNWINFRLRFSATVPVNRNVVVISSCFATLKNVEHSLDTDVSPGSKLCETFLNIAKS